MKISSLTHGILDYIVGVVLLLAPNIFGFMNSGAPSAVARVFGIVVLVQALSTDYECGVFRILSMKSHVIMDYILGALLAVSPWLFGFRTMPMNMWVPHLCVGILAIVVAAMSDTVAGRAKIGGMSQAAR